MGNSKLIVSEIIILHNKKLTLLTVKQPGARTFKQVEQFAAEIFNADAVVAKYQKDNNMDGYTADSWTAEFMNYGCYCNSKLMGGGTTPDANDPHENLCLALYGCYKCINIDYDHTGQYAASIMTYNADINKHNELNCCLFNTQNFNNYYNILKYIIIISL